MYKVFEDSRDSNQVADFVKWRNSHCEKEISFGHLEILGTCLISTLPSNSDGLLSSVINNVMQIPILSISKCTTSPNMILVFNTLKC